MKNKNYVEVLLRKLKKPVRMAAGVMVAGCVLLGGTNIVQAATIADVFDAKQYADDYPDLKEAFGYNEKALLKHYLTYGIKEKREVSGLIDVVKYREAYADLDAAFGDNWNAYVNHYLTYGVYEKRDSGTDFDALAYAERYGDLKATLGDNVLALYKHYQNFGKTEGRNAVEDEPYVESDTEDEDEVVSSAGSENSGNDDSSNKEFNEDGTYWVREKNDRGEVTKETLYAADDSEIEKYEYVYAYDAVHLLQWYKKTSTHSKPNGYYEKTTYNVMLDYDENWQEVWRANWMEWEQYDPDTNEKWYLSNNLEIGCYEVKVTDKNGKSIREDYYDEDHNFIEDIDAWFEEYWG